MVQIQLINREYDVERRENAKQQQLADERVPIASLQGVIETVVPVIEQHVDGDQRELDGDDRCKKKPTGFAVAGKEIGIGQFPDERERIHEA